MKMFALSGFMVLSASPLWAHDSVKSVCGILPTQEVCVSEPVWVGNDWQSLVGAGTDCEAADALPRLIYKLKQAGIKPAGIKVFCSYEQAGHEFRSWELTL